MLGYDVNASNSLSAFKSKVNHMPFCLTENGIVDLQYGRPT